jgi:hypothetical protein
VCPPTPIAADCVAGEGAQISDVAKFMALPALGKNWRVAEADELAPLSEHPNTLFPGLFGDFAGVVHIGKYHCGVLPKVVGGAGVMRHLRNWDVSEDRVSPHLIYEGVQARRRFVDGRRCGHGESWAQTQLPAVTIAPTLRVLQEDVLELELPVRALTFPAAVKLKLPLRLLVALLV